MTQSAQDLPARRGPQPPAQPQVGPPVRWKLWLLVVLSLYPIITLGVTVAEPALAELPTYARFAIIVPIMVAVMLWLVVPLLHKHFGVWLHR
jgi:antibiotic biosynthesis monooxygenase (ABM) superfamily enzyme